MKRFLHVLSSFLVATALGCSGEMVGSGDAGSDAGLTPMVDGGVDAATPLDAGRDAGSDAGPPDGGPPPCACPSFPTTCAPPAVNTPAFTPDAAAVAGQLFDVIACADSTLQIAIYEWEWDCIRDAVQTALDRDPDLVVEIVVDDRMCPSGECAADTLTPLDRVTVLRDTRISQLMHHKFVIADSARLWVSSTNFTERSFCGDHNNAIVVEQAEIVGRYQGVFDDMFTDMTFGPVAPAPPTTAGAYTAYFSPESPTSSPAAWQNAIVAAVTASTTSVEVMISAWTRTEISDALVAAHERGVVVRALVSHLYADDAPAQALLSAGIDVRRDNVHDKTMIIDGATVVTGSANWSENAWSNNENSLWIADPTVASAYVAEFEPLFAAADPVTAP